MSERLTRITITEKPVHTLSQGEVTLANVNKDGDRKGWFIGCPGCEGFGNLSGHDASYDEQAKVLTISPSILCGCGAHYFIVNNEIRLCE